MDEDTPSFKGLLIQYQNVCNWLEELGFNYRNSRYGRYLETFEELALNSLGQISIPKEKQAEFDNAYVEICRITVVHEFFKERDEKDFITQLKEVISGRDIRGEREEDKSRSFFFELWMAHLFLRSGYEVKLSKDPLTEPDILVTVGEREKLAVECKCIYSENKIKANIKKGNAQILKREKFYGEKNIKIRGLVAVDLTNFLQKGIQFVDNGNVTIAEDQQRKIFHKFLFSRKEFFHANENSVSYGVVCESGMLIKMTEKRRTLYKYQTCQGFVHYGNNGFLSSFLLHLGEKFKASFALDNTGSKVIPEKN